MVLPKPEQLLRCRYRFPSHRFWALGDSLFWGLSDDKKLQDVFEYVVITTISSSLSSSSSELLDTAKVYGFGKSEKLIGQFTKNFTPETQAKQN